MSLEEEEAQEKSKPEQPKQLHLTLDANLTLQTRRRYLSSTPSFNEELRKKYWVMTHMWLLAKMRQPNRPMFADLDEKTWNTFLEELLNRENFNFRREIEGSGEMVGPDWNHWLEYEFQLRKEGLRLIREQGVSIQRALWAAYAPSIRATLCRQCPLTFFLRFLAGQVEQRRHYPCAVQTFPSSAAPRVDAQASAEQTGIGGCLPSVRPDGSLDLWTSGWFSLELKRESWPWVYETSDKPSLLISTLEALAVLFSLMLFFDDVDDVPPEPRTKVRVAPTWTDNRGKMSALLKHRGLQASVQRAPWAANWPTGSRRTSIQTTSA